MGKDVTVIMPLYNAEKYIGIAINSVQSQTYPNWELLVVDDCSTDGSAEIVNRYAANDRRIKYLKTGRPSGSPTTPRNIGIEHAQGRYIAFLDSDDVWFPQKLEHQLRLFEKEDTAVVYSNYEKMDEEGNRNERIIVAPEQVSYRQLLKGNVIGNLTGMYDTRKVGKIYCRNIHHEDYVVWLSALKQGYVARNTNTVEALYRVRKRSVSANKRAVIGWQWHIYREIEKLSVWQSAYYFMHYAYKAFQKNRK